MDVRSLRCRVHTTPRHLHSSNTAAAAGRGGAKSCCAVVVVVEPLGAYLANITNRWDPIVFTKVQCGDAHIFSKNECRR